MVKALLRLEGLLFFVLSLLFLNMVNNVPWVTIIIFWFIPDISMAGYLINKKVGAVIYNFGHNYLIATFMVIVGLLSQSDYIMAFAIAYVSHVSLDRALGFGLKYSSGFKDTHMQKV